MSVGHPLIHLGYAYELSSRDIAMEALAHAATAHNYLHKYFDEPSYTMLGTHSTTSLLNILERVTGDTRFDGLFEEAGYDNIDVLFKDHEDLVLEYWNMWTLPNPKEQFEASQHLATCLLAATQRPGKNSYNFFLVHLLTTSHAVRIMLPVIPSKFHVSLVRQWWLLTLAVYIALLRPTITPGLIDDYDSGDRMWSWIDKQSVESSWALDAHYIKALRAMKEAASTWGDKDSFYLKAAVKFAEQFDGWSFL